MEFKTNRQQLDEAIKTLENDRLEMLSMRDEAQAEYDFAMSIVLWPSYSLLRRKELLEYLTRILSHLDDHMGTLRGIRNTMNIQTDLEASK